MSLEYINTTYRIKAKIGQRVEYSGGKEPVQGTITGARNQYLQIRLDGEKESRDYHPTWKLNLL